MHTHGYHSKLKVAHGCVQMQNTAITTVVSHKYPLPPLFATLALVQSAGGGGLYTGLDPFSHNYALPSGAPPT